MSEFSKNFYGKDAESLLSMLQTEQVVSVSYEERSVEGRLVLTLKMETKA